MKILECSSAGDKRFSAFYAKVTFNGVYDTIENHYQQCKRDANNNPCRKGQRVAYCVIKNKQLPATYLTAYYRLLWLKYLKEHPDLVEYATQFDEFTDKFRGKAINCQADCVRAFVKKDRSFFNCVLELKTNLTQAKIETIL